ncbi:MAG: M23 family metallopeptidase [Clostridia bacterium]|nr:M23 family metallopeptidase [Clostridia bacterium]
MKYLKHKTKKFLEGRGFYIVLAACIAAVCVAAWSAAATISSVEDDVTSSSSYNQQTEVSSQKPPVSSLEQVGQNVSDVSDTRPPVSSEQKPSSSDVSSKASVSFTMPINGNVGKGFSDSNLQYSKTYGDMRLHLGVDLQAKEGTEVKAAAGGTVTDIKDDSLWGKTVVIDHGYGIVVHYCGLKNITTQKGEKLSAGTKIGEVGTVPCECEDHSHIHVAVVKDGKYISPLELLAMKP